jgi:aminopeptidase N
MWYLLSANTTFAFNRQDTLRGSNGRGRSWWDVKHYSLTVSIDTATKSISGSNIITAQIVSTAIDSMQIDLQDSLVIDSIISNNEHLSFVREGNAWWVSNSFQKLPVYSNIKFEVFYHGKPRIAKHAPWDGGFIWTKDKNGNPWIAVACQGLGASSWWPCKDYQGDEPDSGMVFSVKDILSGRSVLISNGKGEMTNYICNAGPNEFTSKISYAFYIKNPINSYDVTFYIGNYILEELSDTLLGENGKLDLSFYPLQYNEEKARKQFAVTKQMLHCFEYWMGPYPFYEDGYKLVEAPYLGMEHQSAVAYGNEYKMGYLGHDRSNTGVGLLFDFIIIHESGHEWFGNNITAQDVADNWIHEGLTTYTEALFAECAFGKEKAFQYTTGQWRNIQNDKPVIGNYGVQDDGSGDKYDKGSAVIHMIRMIMNDDEKFRQLLRGLNRDFYHKIVTSAQIEKYISDFAGYDFSALFNQYLRTTMIPKVDWYIKKKVLYYRFTDVVDGFSLPITITSGNRKELIRPTSEWQNIKWKRGFGIEFDKNFLIKK